MTGKKSEQAKLEDSFYAECQLFRLPIPERQFKFHPTRKWAFDFAWVEFRVAAEIQGGTFVGGAHSRGGGLLNDHEKINEAQLLGWRVFQFSSPEVRVPKNKHSSNALAYMAGALQKLGVK